MLLSFVTSIVQLLRWHEFLLERESLSYRRVNELRGRQMIKELQMLKTNERFMETAYIALDKRTAALVAII